MKTFLKIFGKIIPALLTGWIILMTAQQANAQHWGNSSQVSNPFESQYFTNRYLGNPAMAGLDSTLNINVAYRKQFTDLPGAPVTEALTADYNPGKRVGLGLIAYNDNAGLIKQTRVALTYAYHLPLNDYGQKLHFGISAAFAHSGLDARKIVGDETDPVIAKFNGRKNAFEVDYGMAFTGNNLTLQASLINLVGFLKDFDQSTANVATIYMAAAYTLHLKGAINSIEPQLSFRGVKRYNSILDFGANMVLFHHILNLYGMVHSTGNFSTGVGIHYKNLIYIQGSYLSQNADLKQYSNGSFEIDLTLTPFRHR